MDLLRLKQSIFMHFVGHVETEVKSFVKILQSDSIKNTHKKPFWLQYWYNTTRHSALPSLMFKSYPAAKLYRSVLYSHQNDSEYVICKQRKWTNKCYVTEHGKREKAEKADERQVEKRQTDRRAEWQRARERLKRETKFSSPPEDSSQVPLLFSVSSSPPFLPASSLLQSITK